MGKVLPPGSGPLFLISTGCSYVEYYLSISNLIQSFKKMIGLE